MRVPSTEYEEQPFPDYIGPPSPDYVGPPSPDREELLSLSPGDEEPPSSPDGPSRSISTSSKQSKVSTKSDFRLMQSVTSPLIVLNFDHRFHVVNELYSDADSKGITTYIISVIGMFKNKREVADFILGHHIAGVQLDLLYTIYLRCNIIPGKSLTPQKLKYYWTILNRGFERVKFQQTTIVFDSRSMQVHFWYPNPLVEPAQPMQNMIPELMTSGLHDEPYDEEPHANADCSKETHGYSDLDYTRDELERLSLTEPRLSFSVDNGNLTIANNDESKDSSWQYRDESAILDSTNYEGPINWVLGVEQRPAYALDLLAIAGCTNTTINTSNERFEDMNAWVSDELPDVVNKNYGTRRNKGKDVNKGVEVEDEAPNDLQACRYPERESIPMESAGQSAHTYGTGESSRNSRDSD